MHAKGDDAQKGVGVGNGSKVAETLVSHQGQDMLSNTFLARRLC